MIKTFKTISEPLKVFESISEIYPKLTHLFSTLPDNTHRIYTHDHLNTLKKELNQHKENNDQFKNKIFHIQNEINKVEKLTSIECPECQLS